MDTYVYRVSAKHLFGWGWIADFAYRWDAEGFIAHRAARGCEYKVEALEAENALRATRETRLAGGSRF